METGDREGALEDYDWVVRNGSDPELFNEAARQIQILLSGTETPESAEGAATP